MAKYNRTNTISITLFKKIEFVLGKIIHNIEFYTWMGVKHFCFFQSAETGNRAPNSGVKDRGASHYVRPPTAL